MGQQDESLDSGITRRNALKVGAAGTAAIMLTQRAGINPAFADDEPELEKWKDPLKIPAELPSAEHGGIHGAVDNRAAIVHVRGLKTTEASDGWPEFRFKPRSERVDHHPPLTHTGGSTL